MRRTTLAALAGLAISACSGGHVIKSGYALDGDTFTEKGVTYRLRRIDAPELPGHCRPGRRCVPGDPYEARHRLQYWLSRGEVHCKAYGSDYYGRLLVECYAPKGVSSTNISNEMLASGHAQEYQTP